MKTPIVETLPCEIFESPNQRTVCLGTCFAEHFHHYLWSYCLRSYHERHNCTHYSPASLHNLLELIVHSKHVTEYDVYESQYLSLESKLYTTPLMRNLYYSTVEEVVLHSNTLLHELEHEIRQADLILITLGTSDVLIMRSSTKLMTSANHISPDMYYLQSLSVEEIQGHIDATCSLINEIRKDTSVSVILTVSPQRYFWKSWLFSDEQQTDSFVSNQLSKAKLLLASQSVAISTPQVYYFPTYEIVIDELRWIEPLYDNGEFVHAGSDTPPYVMQRFTESFFGPNMKQYMDRMDRISRIEKHMGRVPHLVGEIVKLLNSYVSDILTGDGTNIYVGQIAKLCAIYIKYGFASEARELITYGKENNLDLKYLQYGIQHSLFTSGKPICDKSLLGALQDLGLTE